MSASQSAAVPCRATACQQQSSAPRAAAEAWRGRRLVERLRLAQQDDAASLEWPQHPTCGSDLRSLRGRVDGGDNPQRLVLIYHLEWKQNRYVASGLAACAAGEHTNKQATASRQETAGPLAVPRHGQSAL